MMRASNLPLLLFAGGAAVASFVFWPTISGRLAPSWGHYLGPMRTNMRLDPDVEPGQIEDRRGKHGNDDLSRLGPPPQWGGARGDMPSRPWDEARGNDAERSGDGRLGCWDDVEHRPVDMSFCDRERGGVANDGARQAKEDRPYRRTRYCTNSPGHIRHCSPWQAGPAREGE